MASNDPLLGRQIGNYRLIALINSGSFGKVYQGQHIIFKDEPVVAIKLLHASLHSQKEQEEFINEARVLRKLQHPHILRILDAGFQNGVPYIVTEYAEGGSLRDRLRKSNGRPLPLDEANRILSQIGQALQYAHERHIVHRDLKPENILFNRAGDVLLADFGIAVILATTRTRLADVSGTPLYMAPEQFEGLASTKSDQYSLGSIAYELVTGHQLFTITNPTLEAYWYHHAKVEPIPPSSYNSQLPVHIESTILKSLAKERIQRHANISVFAKELQNSQGIESQLFAKPSQSRQNEQNQIRVPTPSTENRKPTVIDLSIKAALELGADKHPISLADLHKAYLRANPGITKGITRDSFDATIGYSTINMRSRFFYPNDKRRRTTWLTRPVFKRVAPGRYMLLSPDEIQMFHKRVEEDDPRIYQDEYNVDDLF